jgi:hypothetical protein
MGHLPVHLDSRFTIVIDDSAPETAGSGPGALREFRREVRREFTLHDLFDAVLAEITFHGDPTERDTWWREIGSRESETGETSGEET